MTSDRRGLIAVAMVAAASLIATVVNDARPDEETGTVGSTLGAGDGQTPEASSGDIPADGASDEPVLDPPNTGSTTTTTTTTVPAHLDALREIVDSMSADDLARQLIVSGHTGSDIGPAIEESAGSLCIGGIFIKDSAGNLGGSGAEAAREAIHALSNATAECAVEPMIVTDAEAGSVLRVPVDPIESPAFFVDMYDEGREVEALESLKEATAGLARSLEELGVHVSLGIVADVDVEPGFYMAESGRTFGPDPETVAAMVQQMVAAYCDAGVAGTLKHFPNQGATPANPHVGLSISAHNPEQWRSFGAIPYERNQSAPMVMTGHIVYADVDGQTPASMSRAITTGLLRDAVGFNGVIITDDLFGMRGGQLGGADASVRAVKAVEAGADLTLWIDPGELDAIIEALARRIDEDSDFRAQVRSSVARILRLKASFGLVEGIDPGDFELCPPGPADFLPPPRPVIAVVNGTSASGIATRDATLVEDSSNYRALALNLAPGEEKLLESTIFYVDDENLDDALVIRSLLGEPGLPVVSAPPQITERVSLDPLDPDPGVYVFLGEDRVDTR